MYDQVYHQAEGYDMRLHRDDRRHYKGRGLDINKEVMTTIQCSSSSETSLSSTAEQLGLLLFITLPHSSFPALVDTV